MNLGFIGTGYMGEPIARRLLAAGTRVTLWNRTPAKCSHLASHGAVLAGSAAEVFERCDLVFLMLLDALAVDLVLLRQKTGFGVCIAGRTIVNLGTGSPEHSVELSRSIRAAGGRYVEAPVSGSRVQAEQGRLVAMLAGDGDAVRQAAALLAPVTSRCFDCGQAPAAMRLKLAVNHYLIVMVAGLGEAVQAARAAGVNLALMQEILDAGPMASEVSRIKLQKLLAADFTPQAAIGDVRTIAELSAACAVGAGAPAPLMLECVELYRLAEQAGDSDLDMIAVGARRG